MISQMMKPKPSERPGGKSSEMLWTARDGDALWMPSAPIPAREKGT